MTQERRKVRRYGLSLPLKGSLPATDGAKWFGGTVRDISSGGIYFLSERTLNVGTQVHLMMNVDAVSTGGVNVLIDAQATIVRVENWGEGGETCIGIAAVIEQCELVRSEGRNRGAA
jgi:hypothetical protein